MDQDMSSEMVRQVVVDHGHKGQTVVLFQMDHPEEEGLGGKEEDEVDHDDMGPCVEAEEAHECKGP